ncbi:hypothetical protein ACEZCY_15075 [Streptacidiphilus sp. N1-12]|uniref:PT repeat-containing protein n=2 Tax=Streptacidiphilus alkalitolerans TaxID=3342712 RepID=A0ABV6VAC6_9ACTN
MTRLHPRALAAAGIVSLGALLLSGCSSSSAKTATAQPSASGSGSAQFSAYRDCLAKHGVTMPTGRPGGFGGNRSGRPSGGFSRNPSFHPSNRPSGGYGGGGFGGFGGASANPSAQAALKACASLAPQGGFGGRGGGGAGNTALAAFTSCMKDHGVTLPANGGLRSLNTADPKTAAAYKVCKALLPTPGATPAPTPTA